MGLPVGAAMTHPAKIATIASEVFMFFRDKGSDVYKRVFDRNVRKSGRLRVER
jgi:hypothetical protein